MAGYLTALFRRSERKKVITDLMGFDDRMLRDIGITRGDLALMRWNRRVGFPSHE